MPTIGNLAPASTAQARALDTEFAAENAAHNATVRVSVLQAIRNWLRPSQLDVVATATVTNAALFNLEDPSIAAPIERQVTLPQMQTLMARRTTQFNLQARPKVGATAGWDVSPAGNVGLMATLAAGNAGSTMVVAVFPLAHGQTIRSFSLSGSIQSGGNAATLDASLRKITAAAAGGVDALVASMTQLAVNANTIVSSANALKDGLAEVVVEGVSYYILITATTGAACTMQLQDIDITVEVV